MEVAKTSGRRRCRLAALAATIVAVAAAMFVLRLLALCDLGDNGQEAPISYALDIIQNHHWLVQWDANNDIASKPPLLNWLLACSVTLCGGFSFFSLALPSALATAGTALVVFAAGRRTWDERAGWFAALACMLCAIGLKEVTLVRADSLFAFTTALTAWLAFRAWNDGTSWTPAWIAAALATLTKGPLVLVLVGFGFVAIYWERRSAPSLSRPVAVSPFRFASHLRGIVAYLTLTAGWLALAYAVAGKPLLEKLFFQELIHHATTSGKHAFPLEHPHQPPLYFLTWFAPWNIFTGLAIWRALRDPEHSESARRFERFLCCWFVFGLLLFAMAPHQRPDLLWPIIPAAALLAGREIQRFTAAWSWRRVGAAAFAATAILLFGGYWYYGEARLDDDAIRQTAAMKPLAKTIRAGLGEGITVTHVNSPVLLQMYLGAYSREVTYPAAAQLLEQEDPTFVVINDIGLLRQRLGSNTVLHIMAEGPPTRHGQTMLVSNYPRLERPSTQVVMVDGVIARLSNIRRLEKVGGVLRFVPEIGRNASVSLANPSAADRRVRVAFSRAPGASAQHEYALAPGAAVTISAD